MERKPQVSPHEELPCFSCGKIRRNLSKMKLHFLNLLLANLPTQNLFFITSFKDKYGDQEI